MSFLRATLIFALLAQLPAPARDVPIPGDGVRIEIPDDWTIVDHPGFALVATAPDGKNGVTLRIARNPEQKRIDQSYFLDTMSSARQQKAKADHGAFIVLEAGTAAVNGVPADYLHTEEPLPDGQTFYARDFLIAANDKFYALACDASDPFMDHQLNDIAGTFRFDAPPVLPDIERPYYRRRNQVLAAVGIVGALVVFVMVIQWRRRAKLVATR
jgi:hypothetical protein